MAQSRLSGRPGRRCIIQEKGDEPGRYLALITAAAKGAWQAAESWLEDGRVMAINELGEGLPPDGATWPW